MLCPMDLSNSFRKKRTCVFLIHVHLVFVTKYRRNVLTKQILNELRVIFTNICIDSEGDSDHVNLLIEYSTKLSVSILVNRLKGVSSRLIRKKKYTNIHKALWGDNLWSPSYFAS